MCLPSAQVSVLHLLPAVLFRKTPGVALLRCPQTVSLRQPRGPIEFCWHSDGAGHPWAPRLGPETQCTHCSSASSVLLFQMVTLMRAKNLSSRSEENTLGRMLSVISALLPFSHPL